MDNRTVTFVLVVAGLAACVIYVIWSWTSGGSVTSSDDTIRQVIHFTGGLRRYAITHDTLPGPALADAVKVLRGDGGESYINPQYCGDVVDGRDAWGNDFVYEWKDGGRQIVLRSFGPNGVDDGGKSDDIEQRVNVSDYRQQR